jgi:hypothetical protein
VCHITKHLVICVAQIRSDEDGFDRLDGNDCIWQEVILEDQKRWEVNIKMGLRGVDCEDGSGWNWLGVVSSGKFRC